VNCSNPSPRRRLLRAARKRRGRHAGVRVPQRKLSPQHHPAGSTTLAFTGGLRSGWSNRSAEAPSSVSESRITARAAVAAPATRATVESASAPAVSSSTARSVLVSSPDQSVYWALEDSGTIFRSTDRRVWQQQGTGVRSDLLAGEAPSNTVCWVVGRHGTILLTTDGKRWQRIKSPTNADIIGVSASAPTSLTSLLLTGRVLALSTVVAIGCRLSERARPGTHRFGARRINPRSLTGRAWRRRSRQRVQEW